MTNLASRAASIRRTYHLPGLFDNLRQVGEDKFRGKCPMHGGDNRSGFGVERYKGEWRWRCFTGDCGFGDAIDMVVRREGCTLREACDILDGGAALPGPIHQAPVLQPPSAFLPEGILVCDKCRTETLDVRPRTYGNGTTRPKWTESLDQAVLTTADARGWELSARAEFAVGPECLARMGR